MGNQKLLVMCVWMLLVASLCPWVHCKRGRAHGGSGKKSSSNMGLKLAGAAAAGAIGGAVIGHGLSSQSRPRNSYGYEDGRPYDHNGHRNRNGHGHRNHTDWQYNRNTGGSEHVPSILLTLGTVAHIFMWG